MKLTEKVNNTIRAGVMGLSLIVASCTQPPTTENNQGKQLHKDCYGLHIKEKPNNIEVQLYKEGWKVRQDELTEDTLTIQITKDRIKYSYKDVSSNYPLEMKKDGTIYVIQ